MGPPWLNTEKPREQGSTNSGGGDITNQYHWDKPVHATSMAVSASHRLDFVAT